MNRKGLFFWIEMLLLVIVFIIIFVTIPKSADNFLGSKDGEDLRNLGYNSLRGLDNSGVLETYINSTFTSSNFTAVSVYLEESFPSTVEVNLEYFNGTTCFTEAGTVASSCGNFTKNPDTVSIDYTSSRMPTPVTLQLYLRRLF